MIPLPPEIITEPSFEPPPEVTFNIAPERTVEPLAAISVAPHMVSDDAPVASPATATAAAESAAL